jgi:hypothetical protein
VEVKGSTQIRGTKTKVPETVGIKTKVTRTKVPETKTTKVTETKTTKTATKGSPVLRATKVVAEGIKVKTLEGVDTTRPKGITTRATALQTNKVHMILMSIHLISLTWNIQYHALLHRSFQHLFPMNFCMIHQFYLLTIST